MIMCKPKGVCYIFKKFIYVSFYHFSTMHQYGTGIKWHVITSRYQELALKVTQINAEISSIKQSAKICTKIRQNFCLKA